MRQCVGTLVESRVLGRKTLALNLGAVAVWTLGLVLFPQGSHVGAAPWYLGGISLGIVFSKGSAAWLAQQAAAARRLAEVESSFPEGADTKRIELEALRLLARGRDFPSRRFRTLGRRLAQWKEKGLTSKRLLLIEACMKRLEGDPGGAYAVAEAGAGDLGTVEEVNLGLIATLSLEEMGKEEDADNFLARLLESPAAKHCPIVLSTISRRMSERALADPRSVRVDVETLRPVWDAMEARAKLFERRRRAQEGQNPRDAQALEMTQFTGDFLRAVVPITTSSVLDVLGYGHVAAGFQEEGRLFLRQCVELDPDFSYGYLHMGDSFLLQTLLTNLPRTRSRKNFWHAEACYWAAKHVEANKVSRVIRLAEQRLKLVAELSTGGVEAGTSPLPRTAQGMTGSG